MCVRVSVCMSVFVSVCMSVCVSIFSLSIIFLSYLCTNILYMYVGTYLLSLICRGEPRLSSEAIGRWSKK